MGEPIIPTAEDRPVEHCDRCRTTFGERSETARGEWEQHAEEQRQARVVNECALLRARVAKLEAVEKTARILYAMGVEPRGLSLAELAQYDSAVHDLGAALDETEGT